MKKLLKIIANVSWGEGGRGRRLLRQTQKFEQKFIYAGCDKTNVVPIWNIILFTNLF